MKQVYVSMYQNRYIYTVREINSAGEVLSSQRFDCRTFVYRDASGRDFVILTDKDGHIRKDAYYYLNDYRRYVVLSSRRQAAVAIQQYETFCDIYGFDSKNLTPQGYAMFKRFRFMDELIWEGGFVKPRTSVRTVKANMGSIVTYLRRLDASTEAFMTDLTGASARRQDITLHGGHHQTVIMPQSDPDLRLDPTKRFHLPEHLNPTQMKHILGKMLENQDKCMYAITLLGYGSGLRRGEILGLTTEDIKTQTNTTTGEIEHFILLRSRLSDKPFQHAKTLRKPTTKSMLHSTDQKNSVYKIRILDVVYNALMDYIQSSRNIRSEEERMEIEFVSRADSLDKGEGNNHYVFIGKSRNAKDDKGNKRKWNVLSGTMVNFHLNRYFKEEGVVLRNACHALRHSFAMFMAYYSESKLPMEQVQVLMRHASINSTSVYFNIPEVEINKLTMMHSSEMEKILGNKI